MSEDLLQLAKDLLKRLIATPSLSSEEDAAADVMVEFLKEQHTAGAAKSGVPFAEVYRSRNNVWAVANPWLEGKPAILLNSHLDTVPPNSGYNRDPFVPVIEEGRLYGLGSTDAGGALVSLAISFLTLCRWEERPYNLVFAATAEEENSGLGGIPALFAENEFQRSTYGSFPTPSIESSESSYVHPHTCAIVGEPTEMQMAIAERGLLVIDAVAHGVAGHAARQEGENAIWIAMEDINWLQENQMPNVSDFLGSVTWTPTTIHTPNTKHNVVPDRCEFTIDIRIHEGYTHEQILETLRTHLKSELKPRSTNLRSSLIPLDHPLIQAGITLGRQSFGSPTSSDKGRMPIPALKMGPGNSSRSHTADEYIELREIKEGIDLYIDLLKRVEFPR